MSASDVARVIGIRDEPMEAVAVYEVLPAPVRVRIVGLH
jgi:hypothetical protein